MNKRNALTLLILTFFSANAVHAQTPQLTFPVECELGTDCFIANYLDVEPASDKARDYTCNQKTSENHQGTDIALKNRTQMEEGVNVSAVMDGQVLRLRTGQSDIPKTENQREIMRQNNKECGNGILIDHGLGRQSFYCHLKGGSIKVAQGDIIKAGETIAQVGQSGDAIHPHLHFAFIWEGGHVDPFSGTSMTQGCGQPPKPLWKDEIAYDPFAIFDAGFEAAVPDFEALKRGAPSKRELPKDAPAFIYWVGFFHAQKGDEIEMIVRDPDDALFTQRKTTIETSRKEHSFQFTGKRLDEPLKSGIYQATTTFTRKGFPAQTYSHFMKVE